MPFSPVLLLKAKKFCIETKTNISEVLVAEDAVKDADIIATSEHDKANKPITLCVWAVISVNNGYFVDHIIYIMLIILMIMYTTTIANLFILLLETKDAKSEKSAISMVKLPCAYC